MSIASAQRNVLGQESFHASAERVLVLPVERYAIENSVGAEQDVDIRVIAVGERHRQAGESVLPVDPVGLEGKTQLPSTRQFIPARTDCGNTFWTRGVVEIRTGSPRPSAASCTPIFPLASPVLSIVVRDFHATLNCRRSVGLAIRPTLVFQPTPLVWRSNSVFNPASAGLLWKTYGVSRVLEL